MIPHIDPKVDYAFKRIFGSEANAPVLIDLLNAVLQPPPDRCIVAVEIMNPFNEKEASDEKLSIVDVKARDQNGRYFNVEMQMLAVRAYPERVLYYWARIFTGQLSEGESYDQLRATISISFLNDVLFPDVPDCHLDFQLRSSRHPDLVFSGLQSMHLIELPKFRKNEAELSDAFDAWCYFLKNAADLDSAKLPTSMQMPAVQRAMEVLNVISKTDLDRERYLAAEKLERDRIHLEKWARDARAIGREEGIKEGIKEGIVARIQLCQRLLKQALTPKDELLALTLDELEAKAKTLEEQLVAANK